MTTLSHMLAGAALLGLGALAVVGTYTEIHHAPDQS
jgi:hypothetical protein